MSTKLTNITYYLITAFISFCVLIIFVVNPGINHYQPSKFEDMVYGKAWKPFVYRTLLPTTVRVIAAPAPEALRTSLSQMVDESESYQKLFNKLGWEKELFVEYFVVMVLMFLSLWGFVIAVRYLFALFYDSSVMLPNLVSILALLGLPTMFQYTSFLYDFPSLLLYTLGLIFLYQQDWKKFLILYPVACLNKETTILLTFIFFIFYRHKLRADNFYKLLFIQLTIFAVVKVFLFVIFKSNPGTFVEFHLLDHNLGLLAGYDLPLAFAILGMIMLVYYKWQEKPFFIRTTLWALVPLIFLTLFLGYLDELRDYYEVYPTVIILISHSIAKLMGLDFSLKPINNIPE
ncbi:MAG: hypothetical protein JSW63_08790 [Ignavibacterium sp.]|nr:MAG: hypothetical protein JSW63_08790 [Ignavibacterium sp.]